MGHEFVPYQANPHICSVCGAVRPLPCYAVAGPVSDDEALDRPVSADTVLNLLHEYEDTHETIADRLLGRLIALDPDTAMRQLEAAKAHLDERMVRSVAAPRSEATTDDGAPS